MVETTEVIKHFLRLRDLKRTGWIEKRVKDPESVSEHSFLVSISVMLLAPKIDSDLDVDKLIKMALIHDLPESIVGDIVTEKGRTIISSKKDKFKKEKNAMKEIFESEKNEYFDLWLEFQKQSSKEAKVLMELDKFATGLQALMYQKKQPEKDVQELLDYADKYIKSEKLKKIFKDFKEKNKE